jgi:Tfp pilus assembly protein PilX
MYNKNKGIVLVAALLIATILIIITLPYISRVAGEYKMMSKMYNSTLALDLAEAGVERAIWEICYDNSLFPGWTYTPGNPQKWSILNVAFKNLNGNNIGYYDITVSLPSGTTTQTIVSTGYVPTKNNPDATKKITATYAGGQYHYTNSIAAAGPNPSITMSGNTKTDSYDSSLGSYASQPHTKQGNIQTNGPINLSGNVYVNGNANPGPSYPFTGKPPVSGSYATLSAPISVNPIPSATINNAQTNNNNSNITITSGGKTTPYTGGNVLTVSGNNTLTLSGGTYYFTSINISGNAQVNINGASIIYMDGGNITASGNGIVNNGNPANLGIYSTGSSINLSGNSAYVGTVYAPNATVTVSGNENFYGAIVCGKSVDTGNASIHFDLALMNANPVTTNNRITSWLET